MAINKIAEYNNNNKKYERKDVVLGLWANVSNALYILYIKFM